MRLIYLSPVPWKSFSQRPHELVRYFHSFTEGEVLWIDPYPGRFPALSDVVNQRPTSGGTNYDIPTWLTIVKPKALPIEPLPFSGIVNGLLWGDVQLAVDRFTDNSTVLGIGKPTILALHLLSKQCFSSSFYDAMDDYPAFYKSWSRLAMANRERRIIRKVSTILTSSSALQDRLRHLAHDVRLVPNACAAERLPELPKVLRRKDDQVPVIGYVGTIGHWFDWELAIALAKAIPRARFRFIGPVYVRPPALPHNIGVEPPLPHTEALRAMAQFDVGLIPFKRTTLTSSVDPIKFYEYRALGLPVVSSAFGEMALRKECEGVYLIDRNSDMIKVVAQALANCATQENTTQFRKKNSWESRFKQASIFAQCFES
jgi:glycosyltransferase involved in cell wall biosynthesis